ncbi:hypothetical protein OESDEN_17633 [Oesophagostomum dentatum]|uniref:Uncharacterized protein n=1 Tax=Oesophagostomum dentatum TaxID=61180 RepID=A0A0B1SBM3_OESDE|nr:hypothetical protein OESDEN_17633 [Oesophagostomum dentatum]
MLLDFRRPTTSCDARIGEDQRTSLMRVGTEMNTFTSLSDSKTSEYKVLATSNPNHVGYLISEFESVAGYPIEKAIEKDFSGDTKNLLLVSG